ncbi:MAG: hypothetical protein WCP97_07725 [bacterium]
MGAALLNASVLVEVLCRESDGIPTILGIQRRAIAVAEYPLTQQREDRIVIALDSSKLLGDATFFKKLLEHRIERLAAKQLACKGKRKGSRKKLIDDLFTLRKVITGQMQTQGDERLQLPAIRIRVDRTLRSPIEGYGSLQRDGDTLTAKEIGTVNRAKRQLLILEDPDVFALLVDEVRERKSSPQH